MPLDSKYKIIDLNKVSNKDEKIKSEKKIKSKKDKIENTKNMRKSSNVSDFTDSDDIVCMDVI